VILGTHHSELTEERDWIRTQWTAQILDVLYVAPGHPLRAGSSLSFLDPRGDLMIGKTRAHSRLEWANDLIPGSRYLMFVDWNPRADAVVVDPTNEYRVLDNDGLENVGKVPDEISRMSLQQVVDEVNRSVPVASR